MTSPKWACVPQFREMLHFVSLGCHQQMLQMPLAAGFWLLEEILRCHPLCQPAHPEWSNRRH